MTEDDFARELGPLMAGLRESRGECPEPERLVSYAHGEGTEEERAALAAHLDLCPRCASEVELLATAPAEVDDLAWRRVERNLDRRPAPWRPAERTAPRPQIERPTLGLRRAAWLGAAAAALALAVGLVVWRAPGPGDERGPVSTTRGHGLHAMAPAGEARALERFEWAAPPIEATFRVEVHLGDEEIWAGEAAGPPLPAPDDLRALLQPGSLYRWRVQALGADRRVLLESAWIEFRLVP